MATITGWPAPAFLLAEPGVIHIQSLLAATG
jgi:hypothetical protein